MEEFTNVIKGRMAYLGISQERLSKRLGMSRKTLSVKINNPQLFLLGELINLMALLNITNEEITPYLSV